jgi:uncharacterized membrane protein YgcG
MYKFLIICFFLLIAFGSSAQKVYTTANVPNPKKISNTWIADPDGYLKESTIQLLNSKSNTIERLNGTEVAVVVLGSIGSINPADFANELFNNWGVGKKGADNGLLILMVMDKRRVEFSTGYGLEGKLTDIQCVRIQEKYMVPEFKKADYDRGLIAGLDATAEILVGSEKWNYTPLPEDEARLEKFLKKVSKKDAKNYVIDVDSMLTDSILLLTNYSAGIFKDSFNLTIKMFVFKSLEGLNPGKMSLYIREKLVVDYPNLLLWVFDFEGNAFNLYYKFNEQQNIFNEPLMLKYIERAVGDIATANDKYFEAWNQLYDCAQSPENRNRRIEEQTLKELEQATENDNFTYSESGSGGRFWYFAFMYYGIAALSMSMLTLLFVGIVQKIEDPYKKYNSLTFFAFDIWMYIFPLPFIFLGRWVDKLRQIYRDAPRNDPKTGQPMTKLTEKEEDKFLESGQITEERINSIHYDVWATADRKNTLILPYPMYFTKYSRCSKCRYKTYFLVFNRVIYPATTSSSGMGEKKYECKHCRHTHEYTYVIPRISESKSSSGGGSSGGSFGGGSSGGGGGGSSW